MKCRKSRLTKHTLGGGKKTSFSKNKKWSLWRNMLVKNWIKLKDLHCMHVLVEAVLEVEDTHFQYVSIFVYYFFFFFQALAPSAFLLELLWGNTVVSPRFSRHRLKWYGILKVFLLFWTRFFFPSKCRFIKPALQEEQGKDFSEGTSWSWKSQGASSPSWTSEHLTTLW